MPAAIPSPCAATAVVASGSHARFTKHRRLAHVVPPVEREAGDVERQEDFKREIGPTGCGNGGAEPARDEEAADGADCADEAERGAGFEPRCFERERAASLALRSEERRV